MKKQIIWSPNPGPQTLVLSLPDDIYEILYGGARGGGKTDAGIAWLTKWVHIPKFRALIVRRNATDLKYWIDRASWLYAGAKAKVTGPPWEISWPSGAVFRLGHLEDENAFQKYLGHEYQKMVIEELNLIPDEKLYLSLLSACRSTIPGLKPQVFNTTNPGGPGHQWVKNRWHIKDKTLWGKILRDKKTNRLRIFVHASIEDNPKLMENDPDYIKSLDALPEDLRKAWKEGNWDDVPLPGLIFINEVIQARKEGRVGTYPHSRVKPVYTWWDMGRDKTSIGFFQKDGSGWNVIDYYENQGEPLAHYAQVLRLKQNQHRYYYEKHFAPFDLDRQIYDTDEHRVDIARRLGIEFDILPKMPLEDQIEALRGKFTLLHFNAETTDKALPPKRSLLEALASYRRESNPDLNEPKPKPVHDWASHASSMMMQWAITPDYLIRPQVLASSWEAQPMHFT